MLNFSNGFNNVLLIFSNQNLIQTFWSRIVLCCGDVLQDVQQRLWPLPTKCQQKPRVVTTRNVPRHCQMSPRWAKPPLVENSGFRSVSPILFHAIEFDEKAVSLSCRMSHIPDLSAASWCHLTCSSLFHGFCKLEVNSEAFSELSSPFFKQVCFIIQVVLCALFTSIWDALNAWLSH